MKHQNKIELDFSRLYGFRILEKDARSAVSSKVGQVKRPVEQLLGSKVGGKIGNKVGVKN